MHVKRIIWVGSPTDAREQLAMFFHDLLGMTVTTDTVGFTRLSTANGDRVEIFGPEASEYVHLDTGPVAGFWVDDARAARRELIAAGVDSCTDLEFGADGHAWFHFRAPDGHFYELCEHDRFLERSEGWAGTAPAAATTAPI